MGPSDQANPVDVDELRNKLSAEWANGSQVLLEDLLQQLGHSIPPTPIAMKLLHHEVNLRRKHGAPVEISELATRFPRIDANTLLELVELPPPPPVSLGNQIFPERYRSIELIGEGGLGKVWRVFDQRMDRPLAIKVAKQTDPRKREVANIRLQREAILTGSLQHPGIPPVFDHGKLANGSEFFAMKLVEGRTLANILDCRKPSHDADVKSLVAVFGQIAQTVAYAHSQRIVHRDLKPHNVMVGQFGEVQVMDWGMGKNLDHTMVSSAPQQRQSSGPHMSTETLPRSADSSIIDQFAEDSVLHLTQTGEVLGTPAYMPPEQARGDVELIGTASDVFGLGAILFTILTGKHLYSDNDANQVVRMAAAGDLACSLEHLQQANVDSELKQLCVECLQPNIADRPIDGAVVAQRINDYLEGVSKRLEHARINQHSAEVKAAEERKRRVATTWLSVVIIAAVITGLLGVWWQWDKARKATSLAEVRLGDSQEATKLANERLQETREVVDEYFSKISEAKGLLSRTPGTQELRRELLTKAQTYYLNSLAEHGDDPETTLEVVRANQRLAQIIQELKPGSDEVLNTRLVQIETLQKMINHEQYQPQDQHFEYLADAQYAIALVYMSRSEHTMAVQQYNDAEQTLLRWIKFSDSDHARFQLAKTQHNHGQLKGEMGKPLEALSSYKKALAQAEPILAATSDDDEDLADYAQNVATMNLSMGTFYGWYHPTDRSWATALTYTEKAMTLYEKAAQLEPQNAQHHQYIITALNNIGMIHYNNVVKGESRKVRVNRCRAAFDRAIQACQTMINENNGVPEYVRLLGQQLGNYSTFLHYNKDEEGCRDKMQQSAELYKQLALAHPHVTEYSDKAIYSLEFFAALNGQSEVSDAAIEDAIQIFEQLVKHTPNNNQNRVQCALRLAILSKTDAEQLLEMTDTVDQQKQPPDSRLAARALAFLQNGDPDKAIKCLDRIEPKKEFSLRWLVRAHVYHSVGEFEKANEFFLKAQKNMNEQKTASDRDHYNRLLEKRYLELVKSPDAKHHGKNAVE